MQTALFSFQILFLLVLANVFVLSSTFIFNSPNQAENLSDCQYLPAEQTKLHTHPSYALKARIGFSTQTKNVFVWVWQKISNNSCVNFSDKNKNHQSTTCCGRLCVWAHALVFSPLPSLMRSTSCSLLLKSLSSLTSVSKLPYSFSFLACCTSCLRVLSSSCCSLLISSSCCL